MSCEPCKVSLGYSQRDFMADARQQQSSLTLPQNPNENLLLSHQVECKSKTGFKHIPRSDFEEELASASLNTACGNTQRPVHDTPIFQNKIRPLHKVSQTEWTPQMWAMYKMQLEQEDGYN